jgi:hypothetical protein
MPFESPYALTAKFNEYVNSADFEGLVSLMTDDHAFIDSLGSVVSGKSAVLASWASFFRAFPDYRNEFERHCEAALQKNFHLTSRATKAGTPKISRKIGSSSATV